VHGHGDHRIKVPVERKRPDQQAAQRLRETFYFAVFEEVNELPEGFLIAAVRVDRIEIRLTLAADRTLAVFIQRIGIDKRGPAGSAEIVGLERLRERKAGGTNRNPRDALKGLTAQAALIREKKIKERRRKAMNCG